MSKSDLRLYPGGQVLTFGDLCQGAPSVPAAARSENTDQALEFCRAWLAGQEEFIVHTSGSTATPKPIVLSRRQMEASARATGAALVLQPGMTALICLPTRYIAGRMMLVRGLVLGLTMVLVEPSANPLADLPDGLRIDFSAMIPLQLQTILDHSAQNPSQEAIGQLNQLHALLLGGGPVSASLEALLQELQAPVYHTYGMTESATHIALRRLNGRQKSAAFVPLPGVQLTVDERGCLNICSAVTNGQVLQTNDIVDLRPDGSFVWLGRWDNVINSGGVKVQVEKVERAVEQGNLGKRRFFVGALPDRRLGETVTLFIEGAALDDEQEQNLLAHLRTQLDKYELPRRIVYLPGFVETPTGKIDRRRTAEHYG